MEEQTAIDGHRVVAACSLKAELARAGQGELGVIAIGPRLLHAAYGQYGRIADVPRTPELIGDDLLLVGQLSCIAGVLPVAPAAGAIVGTGRIDTVSRWVQNAKQFPTRPSFSILHNAHANHFARKGSRDKDHLAPVTAYCLALAPYPVQFEFDRICLGHTLALWRSRTADMLTQAYHESARSTKCALSRAGVRPHLSGGEACCDSEASGEHGHRGTNCSARASTR